LFEVDNSIAPKEWNLESLPILPEKFKLKLRPKRGSQFKVIKELLKNIPQGVKPQRLYPIFGRD